MGALLLFTRDGLFDHTSAPAARTRLQNNPTLLYSWWCTCFSVVIILFRLGGRYVRSERLFREDVIMAVGVVPLFVRMGLIHVVLLYGTNNISHPEYLSDENVRLRTIGAGLVLPARISYALFLWTAKFTIAEFLKRLTESFWRREFELALRFIRYFLIASFLAVVIATLAECHPFHNYWQVRPDPGPHCRLGYAQLTTMGVMDTLTDLVLIIFPIPVILTSGISVSRKIKLILLFSMSAILVAVAIARIPAVIHHHGQQQYRTVWASTEILLATAVSNAVILGSFLRDRGTKKQKFKFGSASESVENQGSRRPTIKPARKNSVEDLVRSVGMRLGPEFADEPIAPRPAPMAEPATPRSGSMPAYVDKSFHFPDPDSSRDSEDSDLKDVIAPVNHDHSPRGGRPLARRVSFFDVGGLLETGSMTSSAPLVSPPLSSAGSAADNIQQSSNSRQGRSQNGSRALLADIGGLLAPSGRSHPQSGSKRQTTPPTDEDTIEIVPHIPERKDSPPIGVPGPKLRRRPSSQSLQDAGGLLDETADTLSEMVSLDVPTSSSPASQVSLRNSPRSMEASSAGDPSSLGGHQAASPSPSSSRPGNRRKPPSSATAAHGKPKKKKRVSLQLQDVGGLLSDP